ncbi:MAG: PD-(D/E)XK nuclease family protein, partial [Clostridia bacterium]|nr:PD-(D/E)XK nuclease family protein [Clostridia bacterium]
NHPLVTLILSYLNAYRKGLERKELCAFFKNPLFSGDKKLTDALENYLIKYNINYSGIHRPFTYPAVAGASLEQLEKLRQKISALFKNFNVRKALKELGVEDALKILAEQLKSVGENEQASVTEQVFNAVSGILDEMEMMLGGVELTLAEYKDVFLSGVSALKLSVIPQYNDAVFVGGFKETALAKAKYLFALGLDSSVPAVQSDIALLSDDDIDALETVKVLVEPKIQVVNHREREYLGMALSAFSDGLFLSYSIAGTSGDKKTRSQVLSLIEQFFTIKPFPYYDGYITYKQAFNTFAKACGEFAEGKTIDDKDYDFTVPSSFFKAVDAEKLRPLLDGANKEVKVRLDGNRSLVKKVISPTTIEDYYKCPFRAFLSHNLKIKDRENGEVGVLSVGNLMHEILSIYVENVKSVNNREQSDELFEKIKNFVLEKDDYKKFLDDGGTNATVQRVLRECKEYAYKTYLSLVRSSFTTSRAEVSFSDSPKAEYPSIPLNGGKVKIKGKIDRVDLSDKFYRVVDYKTGKADPSEKALFAGVKLQLYLYAQAVKNKFKDGEIFPAGLYYLPVSDKYEKPEDKGGALAVGQTLNDEKALLEQDKEFFERGESEFAPAKVDGKKGEVKHAVSKQTLLSYMDYAIKISESAVDKLEQGVMVASPYKGECEYCQFGGLCGMQAEERTVGSVDKSSFEIDRLGEVDE